MIELAGVVGLFAAIIGGTRVFVERGIARRAGRPAPWPPQITRTRPRRGNYGRNFEFRKTWPNVPVEPRPHAVRCDCGWCAHDPTRPAKH